MMEIISQWIVLSVIVETARTPAHKWKTPVATHNPTTIASYVFESLLPFTLPLHKEWGGASIPAPSSVVILQSQLLCSTSLHLDVQES